MKNPGEEIQFDPYEKHTSLDSVQLFLNAA